jgi:hypothetical protein
MILQVPEPVFSFKSHTCICRYYKLPAVFTGIPADNCNTYICSSDADTCMDYPCYALLDAKDILPFFLFFHWKEILERARNIFSTMGKIGKKSILY